MSRPVPNLAATVQSPPGHPTIPSFKTWLQQPDLLANPRVNQGLRLVVAVYFLIVTWSFFYEPVRPGLDPGWRYALNHLVNSPYLFGRDAVFTYGPLGYLLYPLDIGQNLIRGTIFRLVVHLIFAVVTISHIRRAASLTNVCWFVALYVIATIMGMHYETHLLFVVTFLLWTAIRGGQVRPGWLLTAGWFGGTLLFTKLSMGVSAALMLAATAMAAGQAWKTVALRGGIAYVATILFVGGITMPTLMAFGPFLQQSLEIVRGYDVAMVIEGPDSIVQLGCATLLLCAGLVVALRRSAAGTNLCAFLAVTQCVLAFKQGFVRQDGHEILFFPAVLVLVGLVILCSAAGAETRRATGVGIIALLLALPVTYTYRTGMTAPAAVRLLMGQTGWDNGTALFRLPAIAATMRAQGASNLAPIRLPGDWRAKIGDATIDVLPWDLSYVPANALNWRPNPSLQLYTIHTAFIDQRTATHFASQAAPQFLIVEYADLESKLQMTSAPATWNTIVSNYQPVGVSPLPNIMLLEKRPVARPLERVIVSEVIARIGQPMPVPPSRYLVSLDLQMKLNVSGAISKTLFRVPRVYFRISYASGRTVTAAFIPETAINGMSISILPTNHSEFAAFMRGAFRDRVTSLQITGPGAAYYRSPARLTWWEDRQFPAG